MDLAAYAAAFSPGKLLAGVSASPLDFFELCGLLLLAFGNFKLRTKLVMCFV